MGYRYARWTAAILLVGIQIILIALPASAQDPSSDAWLSGDDTAEAEVVLTNTGTGHSPGSAPHEPAEKVSGAVVWSNAGCTSAYDPERSAVTFVDLGPATLEQVQAAGYDETGEYRQMQILCLYYNVSDGSFGGTQQIVLYEVTPPVDPTVLRDRAMARITVPTPSVGMAPAGSSDIPAITQLETWLWVNDPWETLTDSESQGFVTVEVRVRPRSVFWEMGDSHVTNNGGHIECGGPGTVWSAEIDSEGTPCGYAFRSSTIDEPGGVYHGSATVNYDLFWSINGVDQGSFGTLQPSSPFTVAVSEIQVVNS